MHPDLLQGFILQQGRSGRHDKDASQLCGVKADTAVCTSGKILPPSNRESPNRPTEPISMPINPQARARKAETFRPLKSVVP